MKSAGTDNIHLNLEKLCGSCGKRLPLSEFYTKGKGRHEPLCKGCSKAKRNNRYKVKRKAEKAILKRRKSNNVLEIVSNKVIDIGSPAEDCLEDAIEGFLGNIL